MIKKYKKGDEVIVKVGKDKGKIGKISKVITSNEKVIITGVNVSKKHQKPSQDSKGGIVDKEMPIHISNTPSVTLQDPPGTPFSFYFFVS